MSKDTSGPAFPLPFIEGQGTDWNMCGGLSVRDYFAAAALTGLCSAIQDNEVRQMFVDNARETCVDVKQRVATAAFEYADAMLFEHAK